MASLGPWLHPGLWSFEAKIKNPTCSPRLCKYFWDFSWGPKVVGKWECELENMFSNRDR
jgi:hypothetical protein